MSLRSSIEKFVSPPMKLIVLDRFLVPGGVETTKLNLLPEIANQIELLVWVLPSYKIPYFQEKLPDIPNLVFEPIEWPYGNVYRYTDSLVRRATVLTKDPSVLPAPLRNVLDLCNQAKLGPQAQSYSKEIPGNAHFGHMRF